MSKIKATHSSVKDKSSVSLHNKNEIAEEESSAGKSEKYILQNPLDRFEVDDSRDESEDLPEEDPEEGSSEELEEYPEEDMEIDKKSLVSGNEEKSHSVNDLMEESDEEPEEDPEEDPDPEIDSECEEVSVNEEKSVRVNDSRDQLEDDADHKEESVEEPEEDPEEDPDLEIDSKCEELSGNEEKSDCVNYSKDQLEGEAVRNEESGEESEEDPEEDSDAEINSKCEEQSGNEEKSDCVNDSKDPLEDEAVRNEESEEDPEEDPDPEINSECEEVSGNEAAEFSRASLHQSQTKCSPEAPGREKFESEPSCLERDECEAVSGNEVPLFSQASLYQSPKKCSPEESGSQNLELAPSCPEKGESEEVSLSCNEVPLFSQAPLYLSQKKCSPEASGSQNLQLEPSRPERAPVDKLASKEEAGSSGNRKRSRWEPQTDGDGIKEDDETSKRRKTRWSNIDTQIENPSPLQLPVSTEDFVIVSDKEQNIQRLKAELLEINQKLLRPLHDDRPEEARLREELVHRRQNIISALIKLKPIFVPPLDSKPPTFFKKLYIPVKEYPDYNFVGLIIGPRGNTQKKMEKETGAKILLRGKGSMKTPSEEDPQDDDLHVLIEANDQKSLDAAVGMVEKLLIPMEDRRNEHKLAQLKELAVLKMDALRDKNVCCVCGEHGHRRYACPNLPSTFKMDSFDAGSNGLSTPTYPVTALLPQSDSVKGSVSSLSSTQNNGQTRRGNEINDKHLYVGFLPQSMDENRLKELFSPFGTITEAKIVKDRTTGTSRGFGFVTFIDSKDAALAAARLNGFKIDGKFLRVNISGLQPKNESPSMNLIPQKPAPAAPSPNITSQTDWSGPFHFMLPEHQSSFNDISDAKLFSCTINSDYGDPNKSLVFAPPGNTLNPPDSGYSSNMHNFSGNFSFQSLLSPDNSTTQTQFPSDPGYPGSGSQPYFYNSNI
ncbi:hypothetical protein RIF29_23694 [Crotalaria pallida]|uniref:RRM domain-containing protein n=1 Tax=Crotalaria pallida TaxID=3830 RepID=A0AAN9I8Q9_CROPI